MCCLFEHISTNAKLWNVLQCGRIDGLLASSGISLGNDITSSRAARGVPDVPDAVTLRAVEQRGVCAGAVPDE